MPRDLHLSRSEAAVQLRAKAVDSHIAIAAITFKASGLKMKGNECDMRVVHGLQFLWPREVSFAW